MGSGILGKLAMICCGAACVLLGIEVIVKSVTPDEEEFEEEEVE